MCRAILAGGRRCPCSLAPRRSAADRARYAARKAAGLTSAPPTPAASPTSTVPSTADLQSHAAAVASAYAFRTVTPDTATDPLWEGDREQGLIRLGEKVADRAEYHAGITSEEVRARWERRFAEAQAEYERVGTLIMDKERELNCQRLAERHSEAQLRVFHAVHHPDLGLSVSDRAAEVAEARRLADEARSAYNTARSELDAYRAEVGEAQAATAWRKLRGGNDDETRTDLTRLANGYTQALAEVRPLGGTMTWAPGSARAAVAKFDLAAQVYPTEWIEKSNARVAPIAKTTTGRAHYSDSHAQTSKQRVHLTKVYTVDKGWEPPSAAERSRGDLQREWTRDESNDSPGAEAWRVAHYAVVESWRDADEVPRGRGWERVSYRDNAGNEQWTWRRPVYVMETVSRTFAPEIKVGDRRSILGGPGSATATHELAHRMEATMPMIGVMEKEFITRRTTTDGVRDKTVSYMGSRKEQTRPDGFADVYMGKDYGSSAYHEVMSTGTEGLFNGSCGGLVGVGGARPDLDTRAFILGVLAAAK